MGNGESRRPSYTEQAFDGHVVEDWAELTACRRARTTPTRGVTASCPEGHMADGDTPRPVFARGGLGVVGETSGDGLDHARATAVRELRQQILKMPRAAKAQLRLGPQTEPACGVCSGLHAGNYCSHPIEDYHDVGITDFAQMIGAEDFEQLGEAMPDEALPLIRALAGALAAERSLVVYLLAGWKP